jgi:hypothetical protein
MVERYRLLLQPHGFEGLTGVEEDSDPCDLTVYRS